MYRQRWKRPCVPALTIVWRCCGDALYRVNLCHNIKRIATYHKVKITDYSYNCHQHDINIAVNFASWLLRFIENALDSIVFRTRNSGDWWMAEVLPQCGLKQPNFFYSQWPGNMKCVWLTLDIELSDFTVQCFVTNELPFGSNYPF